MQIEKPFPKEERLFPTKKEVALTKMYKMQKYNEDSWFEEIKSLGYKLSTARMMMYCIRKITATEKDTKAIEDLIKKAGKPTIDIIGKLYDKHTAIWTPPEDKTAKKFKVRVRKEKQVIEPQTVNSQAVEPIIETKAEKPKTQYMVTSSNVGTTILPNKDTAMGFIAALENIMKDDNIKLFEFTNMKEVDWQSQRLENGSLQS